MADALPIWLLFIATILIVMASIEGGYRLGMSAHRKSDDEKESPVSAITGSVLGLGAFLLAFTFGIVSERFDARKGLVRDEANAVRTAWLRSDFLPEPDRLEAKSLLNEIVDEHLAFVLARDFGEKRVNELTSTIERIHGRLWEMAVVHARKDMNSDVAALYIEALNDVFSLRALRVAVGLQARVPTGIWLTLMAVTSLGMMGVGYQTGIAGSRRSRSRPILALSFAIVITLIAALDRPGTGFISVTQQPLIDLQAWLSRNTKVIGSTTLPTTGPSESAMSH